jgi:hypothetical protein
MASTTGGTGRSGAACFFVVRFTEGFAAARDVVRFADVFLEAVFFALLFGDLADAFLVDVVLFFAEADLPDGLFFSKRYSDLVTELVCGFSFSLFFVKVSETFSTFRSPSRNLTELFYIAHSITEQIGTVINKIGCHSEHSEESLIESMLTTLLSAKGGCASGAEFLTAFGMTCSNFIAISNALCIPTTFRQTDHEKIRGKNSHFKRLIKRHFKRHFKKLIKRLI